jgi:hypothetical protein
MSMALVRIGEHGGTLRLAEQHGTGGFFQQKRNLALDKNRTKARTKYQLTGNRRW